VGLKLFRDFIVLVALLGAYGVAAAQPVVLEHDAPLLAQPRGDARVVAPLKRGAKGELLARKGAWVNIRTEAGSGWVNSFNVREQPASGAAPLGKFVTPSRKPVTTATIGIRGLEAEDLKSARIDAQQVKLLDTYAASRQEAEEAAQASGLNAARVEYFTP